MIVDLNNNKVDKLIYLGTDYGGWGLNINLLNQNSIVYSFGIGTDISFDIELINRINCLVYAFDPTPRSLKWISEQNLSEKINFTPLGLSDFDGISFFNEPPNKEWVSYSETKNPTSNSVSCEVRKLSTFMKHFGHERIDLLKMDIEGSEYGVLNNLLEENIYPNQILVEFHGKNNIDINDLLLKFDKYEIYKKYNRNDFYLIKKNV